MQQNIPCDIQKIKMKGLNLIDDYDWDDAIQQTEGETSKLLYICKCQCGVLKNIIEWPSTPETMAYLTLWTRNFNITQGAISIVNNDTPGIVNAGRDFLLNILWRPVFELSIILNFILYESAAPEMFRSPSNKKFSIEYRLCAYLAWSLWNDKEICHKLTQKWRLDHFYTDNVSENNSELKEMLNFFWGEDGNNDTDNKKMKHNVRSNSFEMRSRLKRWLEDEKLCDFEERLRNDRPRSYFELVIPENKSLAGLLRSSWTDAGYPAYQEASALIHGCTFVGHMEPVEDCVFPKILSSDEDLQRAAAHVRRYCHINMITLSELHKRLVDQLADKEL